MITIKNRYNEAKIFADVIDSAAEGLIKAFCSLPVSAGSKVRIMPDVHAGKGCVIGMTMTINDTIVPGLIGVDIGCGVSVMKVTGKRLELQRLDKLIRESACRGKRSFVSASLCK